MFSRGWVYRGVRCDAVRAGRRGISRPATRHEMVPETVSFLQLFSGSDGYFCSLISSAIM